MLARAVPELATLGFVPASHRWMVTLCAGLRRSGIGFSEAVLADGALRVTLLPGTRTELVAVIRPRRAGIQGVASTRFFTLGFDGARELGVRERTALARLVLVLGRLEHAVPAELAGHAAIVRRSSAPERDLCRLFPFVDVERSRGARNAHVEVLVRATRACNQACPFCSAPDHAEPDEEALRACFTAVARLLPDAALVVTGGEPSLRPHFIDEVAHALSLPGVGSVQVQTNAVPFAKKHDPTRLVADAKLGFFVSLHSLEPERYDRCTGTRGQLEPAMEGIRRLLAAGHGVTLNVVASSLNLDHLEELARRLPDAFPGPNRPRLHFSALMCPERSPGAAEFLVRYPDLVPAIERAAQAALDSGTEVESLLASTHASLPTCVLPSPLRAGRQRPELRPGETGHARDATPWVKAPRCADCGENAHCLGVPRAYAERFGLDDLQPVKG